MNPSGSVTNPSGWSVFVNNPSTFCVESFRVVNICEEPVKLKKKKSFMAVTYGFVVSPPKFVTIYSAFELFPSPCVAIHFTFVTNHSRFVQIPSGFVTFPL